MVEPFEEFFPEITQRKKELERVFGKEVSQQLEREAEVARTPRGGGRRRPPPQVSQRPISAEELREEVGAKDVEQQLKEQAAARRRQQEVEQQERTRRIEQEREVRETSFLGRTRDVFFGETGRQLVGFRARPITGLRAGVPELTFERTEDIIGRRLGLTGRVITTITPETPGGIALFAAAPVVFGKAPVVVGKAVSGVIGVSGVKTAVTPGLLPEERIAGGIIGTLGFGGTVFPTRTQLGIKQQKAQLKSLVGEGFVTPETGRALGTGIKLQRFLRRQPDVPIVKPVREVIPKGLKPGERRVVEGFIFEKEPTIFGGKTQELRGLRKAGDIDVGLKESKPALQELVTSLKQQSGRQVIQRGEAVGVRREKLLDVKPQKEYLLLVPLNSSQEL
jgi:hypothetical protein